MSVSHRSEMPMVECDDQFRAQALCQRDHGGVDPTEGEVRVALHQLADTGPIGCFGRADVGIFQGRQELGLHPRAKSRSDQVGRLGHNQGWDDQPKVSLLQHLEAAPVVLIVGVHGRVERSGVNDRELKRQRALPFPTRAPGWSPPSVPWSAGRSRRALQSPDALRLSG